MSLVRYLAIAFAQAFITGASLMWTVGDVIEEVTDKAGPGYLFWYFEAVQLYSLVWFIVWVLKEIDGITSTRGGWRW